MSTKIEQDSDLLFEYLRSILYETQKPEIDPETMEPELQKLAKGLQFLDHAVWEMKAYSANLAKGNLSVVPPPRDNFLCENLKGIHANLNHLTWQAKQVAKGDYSQTVSYLGEFSAAFNSMTDQLRERETELKTELSREREEQLFLEQEVRRDPLTGIGNRFYFQEGLRQLLQNRNELTFCYCDLDQLKFVNDTYGHAEGDRYLCEFVELVKESIRDKDLFARVGGDEFCVILRGCDKEHAAGKLERIQKAFYDRSTEQYYKSFSYGIVHLPEGEHTIPINELLHKADQAMYEQKSEHRLARAKEHGKK